MKSALVSIFCPDRTGLVAAITGRLFELGSDLGDTSFAVIGEGAEFTTVCDIPDDLGYDELAGALSDLPETAGARVSVSPFTLDPNHGPSGNVTHVIVIGGGDRPGLIARLSEVFVQFKANIVRLDAQRLPTPEGTRYVTRFAVWIPERSVDACLATVANTAGELRLSCHWEAAPAGE